MFLGLLVFFDCYMDQDDLHIGKQLLFRDICMLCPNLYRVTLLGQQCMLMDANMSFDVLTL